MDTVWIALDSDGLVAATSLTLDAAHAYLTKIAGYTLVDKYQDAYDYERNGRTVTLVEYVLSK